MAIWPSLFPVALLMFEMANEMLCGWRCAKQKEPKL